MTLPKIKTPIPGPKSRRMLKELHRAECPHVTFGDREFPVFIDSARGLRVTDVDGNELLDFTAFFAVSNLGHAAPAAARALRRMAGRGWHAMGDVHPHVLKLEAARALTRFVPGDLSRVFFSSSGSDAVETAMKTAFLYTGRPGVIAFEGAYHGLGYGALQATHRRYFRGPFTRQSGNFVRFWEFVAEGEKSARQADEALRRLRVFLKRRPSRFGAMIVEPIQGRAGVRPADPRFLRGLKRICRECGMLLIFDEIYTGFGRTGKRFAFMHSGVRPDILCLGKGIANGFPISACVFPARIASAWGKSPGEARHTSTFLGNPLGCAMILEVLAELKRGGWIQKAETAGRELGAMLERLRVRHPRRIAGVRGKGLMRGLVLKKGSGAAVMKAALKRGLILLPAGPRSEVVTFTPPFGVRPAHIRQAERILDEVLGFVRR